MQYLFTHFNIRNTVMQNMTKTITKICKPISNMQNTDRSIFCIFVIYMHSHFAYEGAGVTRTVECGWPPTAPGGADLKEPRSARVSRPFGIRSMTGKRQNYIGSTWRGPTWTSPQPSSHTSRGTRSASACIAGRPSSPSRLSSRWARFAAAPVLAGALRGADQRPKRPTAKWAPRSSNRSWAYTGENYISPSASKSCPRRKSTTTCKGTAHGLTYKTNI